MVPNELRKRSRSFCDGEPNGVKERIPVRVTSSVFKLAVDAEGVEEKTVDETRNSLDLTNCEYKGEEKKDLDPNWGQKDFYPEIIVTQCKSQVETISESEKLKSPKKKFLFTDFNERYSKRKKQIEQMKLHEQRLKEVSMEKYPFQWTKKKYTKSTFHFLYTLTTSSKESVN